MAIGGTVSYAAFTAAALERSVGILTSTGDDCAFEAFEVSPYGDRITITSHTATATTTFRNVYDNGHRRQLVYDVAALLTPALLPGGWGRPRIAHIGPVIGECDPAWVRAFTADTFVGVTPQGWMRARNGDGQVEARLWDDAGQVLGAADAVVFSIEDVLGDWSFVEQLARQVSLLVVTLGRDGGVLFVQGQRFPFPAHRVVEVDPTGAGDIFATVFFDAVAFGTPPFAAAQYAACLASCSVTRVGLASTPRVGDMITCRNVVRDAR